MSRFLLGVVTGVVLVFALFMAAVVAAVALRPRAHAPAQGSTLILSLSGDVPEKPAVEIPFLQDRAGMTVETVWSALRRAESDPRIAAVVFEPRGVSIGWARMEEIRGDLERFRKTGKPLIAWLRSPSAREYYMASACSEVYLAPQDLLDLKGLTLETMYFRNTLDKLGVKVDVEHAGKYKDYGDMFVRSGMSPETREVLNGLADGIFDDLVAAVARGRKREPAAVRAAIDDGPFLSAEAKAAGLVDDVRYEDQVFGNLKNRLHQTDLKKISGAEYAASAEPGRRNRIAFVAAEGSITGGDGAGPDLDSGLTSDAFDRTLERVGKDEAVKGVIVRINSPGGEVTASDEMWRAMNELRRKKPLVISMSDYAASGGYYMAMSGDPIVAYPATLTGSIGVVFGKPNLRGLYEKLGVTKEQISRGRFALIESDYSSLSPAETEKLRHGIDVNYEDFVSKVAAARKRPVAEIEAVAQGRVWLGSQAKGNGLVDELGGLDRAVELIRGKAGIGAGEDVTLVPFPERRSVLDLVLGKRGPDALGSVPAALRASGMEELATAWQDAGLRVWMRGGMLRMLPFTLGFR